MNGIALFKSKSKCTTLSEDCISLSEIWGQFHQQFTSSFYACRSQKCKKDSQLKKLFALLGSACIKAALKHLDEIDPWMMPRERERERRGGSSLAKGQQQPPR